MALDLFKTNGSSPPPPPPKVDLLVHGGGSVYLLRPVSQVGEAWIEEHLPADATWFGGAVVVEHRYIHNIVIGAVTDGLGVK